VAALLAVVRALWMPYHSPSPVTTMTAAIA
jgi:hypothetical protein